MLQHHFRADPKSRLPQLRRRNRLCRYTATPHVTDEMVRLWLREVVGRCVMSLAGAGSVNSTMHPWFGWRGGAGAIWDKDDYECAWFVWRVGRHCL